MYAQYALSTVVVVMMLVGGCGLQGAGKGPRLDVTLILSKTREEAIQVLGEPSSGLAEYGQLNWHADRVPPDFQHLQLTFDDEGVCIFVQGQIKVPGDDLEQVLDAVGLGQLQKECRRMERGNALVVSCVASPYEAEIVEPRHPGISTKVRAFTVWRQDSSVTQSLATEFDRGKRGFQDSLQP